MTKKPLAAEKPPLAYTIQEAAVATGYGTTTINNAVKRGELIATYGGDKKSKPVIRVKDLDAWLDALPTEKP